MEDKDWCLKGASSAEWLLIKVRVALAVAIIKNKPSGLSGREYAEVLTRQLESRDGDLKKKNQELQQEVLRLRQELLMSKVTSSSAQAAGHDDTVDDASQDLFGPVGLDPSTEHQLDCDSETPELLLEDHQRPAHPIPPDGAILPHVQFIQSLCALHRINENHRDLDSLWLRQDGHADLVLADTVCQLLEGVVVACRDPPALGSPNLVLQACQVVARGLDLFCSQRLPSVELMRRVEGSLKELTAMLLRCNQLSGLLAAEKLMEYLTTLGSSSMSKSFLIRYLLAQISALADQLWQVFQVAGEPERNHADTGGTDKLHTEPLAEGQDNRVLQKFPVDQYQNSLYLFWILEDLLRKSKVACRVEVGSEQTGFMSHLDQRVFLLSHEFPLFSINMWWIGGLLRAPKGEESSPPPHNWLPPEPPLC